MVLRLSEILTTGDLVNLNKETLDLVRQGSWSLYKLSGGWDCAYVIKTPRQNQCCNRHPQQVFYLKKDGSCIGGSGTMREEGAEIVFPDSCFPQATTSVG